MPLRSPRTHASIVHQTVTTSNGGPHLGRDTFVKTNGVGAPVAISAERKVRLTCNFEACNRTYDVDVFTIKERLKYAGKRLLAVAGALAISSFMTQAGTWVYDAGNNSQALRILGGTLTGAGIIISLLVFLLLLMNSFFWPPSYNLKFVEPSDDSGAKSQVPVWHVAGSWSGHSVKLLVSNKPIYD